MCELLGLNFNEPVTCSFSFRLFRERGNDHPDGLLIGSGNFVFLRERFFRFLI